MFQKILLLAFFFLSLSLNAQVEGVKYILEHNCETNQYDIKILITSGSASSIPHRAQFNSQISIVVPTGLLTTIEENHNPLVNNQNYTGTEPTEWLLGYQVESPAEMTGYDLHSIVPSLSPASFYNDLEAGDEVVILSFTAGDSEIYNPEIRLFDNDSDPTNIGGADFSNGFTIGGSAQKYEGNIHRSCLTSTKDAIFNDFVVYPNPTASSVSVDLPIGTEAVELINAQGQTVHVVSSGLLKNDTINLDMEAYPSGIYFIKIKVGNIGSTARIIKE